MGFIKSVVHVVQSINESGETIINLLCDLDLLEKLNPSTCIELQHSSSFMKIGPVVFQ